MSEATVSEQVLRTRKHYAEHREQLASKQLITKLGQRNKRTEGIFHLNEDKTICTVEAYLLGDMIIFECPCCWSSYNLTMNRPKTNAYNLLHFIPSEGNTENRIVTVQDCCTDSHSTIKTFNVHITDNTARFKPKTKSKLEINPLLGQQSKLSHPLTH